MITAASLKTYRLKDLAQMARKRGVSGWHSMRKDQLIRALVATAARSSSAASNGRSRSAPGVVQAGTRRAPVSRTSSDQGSGVKPAASRNSAPVGKKSPRPPHTAGEPAKTTDADLVRRIQEAHAHRERLKDLARSGGDSQSGPRSPLKDRVVLMVRDPYWLHAYWEVTSQSISRAQAALAEQWHTARPVLRLMEVARGGASGNSERILRDIEIHGGVRNWYIDVANPPGTFRVDVGYLGGNGRFLSLARSNVVTTPRPGSTELVDHNWTDVAQNYERIFALSGGYSSESGGGELQELFEERLRRPMGSPMVTRYGRGAELSVSRQPTFHFDVDAEMIVFGITRPDAHVTLSGEPVKLRPDGSFTARMSMPDRRQVVPIVASSADGLEERTIVLAVERNTKAMEPVVRDAES